MLQYVRQSWTFGTVIIMVCGTLISGCVKGGDSEASKSEGPRIVESATAPDGGVVRVVESGFSVDVDRVARCSFGAVVENTSKEYVVSHAGVHFRFLDEAGKATEVFGKSETIGEARMIPPGGRAGVGHEAGFPNVNSEEELGLAAVSAVVQGEFVWVRSSLLPKMEISSLSYQDGEAGAFWLSFTLDSEYPTIYPWPDLVFVYRDATGAILGGRECQYMVWKSWPQGHSTQRVEIPLSMPVVSNNVFLGKTELYVHPVMPVADKNGKRLKL